jgi:tRNA A37 threonylcarbamoyladenosine modification protein TsaB
MEKQTATEWLFKQLWEEPKDKFTWNAILSKAKEMEKQQIMDAANKLLYHSTGPSDTAAEQYYNETFKKD